MKKSCPFLVAALLAGLIGCDDQITSSDSSSAASVSADYGVTTSVSTSTASLTTVIPWPSSQVWTKSCQRWTLDSVPWGTNDGRTWTQQNTFSGTTTWDVKKEFWYSWWVMDALSIHRKNLKDPRTLSMEDPILLYDQFASDSFSYYLPVEYVKKFEQELSGESNDSIVGIRFSPFFPDTLTVGDLAPAGAARVAGLRRKDRIIAVNGDSALSVDSALARIQSLKTMTLGVRRPGVTDSLFTVSLTKTVARFPSVWFDTLGGTVGYIGIDQFVNDSDSAYATGDLVKHAAAALAGAVPSNSTVIIDLQNNPGGELSNSLKSASQFLAAGDTIIHIRSRDIDDSTYGGVSTDSLPLASGSELTGRNFMVLINSGTASAAEILTSALRSNLSASGKVKLIGTKTFGKGIGQTLMETPSGAFLRITSLEIFPAGRTAYASYDGIGIAPDVVSSTPLATALGTSERSMVTARVAGTSFTTGGDVIVRWNHQQTSMMTREKLLYRRLLPLTGHAGF